MKTENDINKESGFTFREKNHVKHLYLDFFS